MDNVRIAMLGGGFVADFYMQGLQDVGGHEVVVATSRSGETAEAFARKWNIPGNVRRLRANDCP